MTRLCGNIFPRVIAGRFARLCFELIIRMKFAHNERSAR